VLTTVGGYYRGGYKAMGAALEASGRDITYSCSWPAYINGGNETLQPFAEFINDGCNLWRNWHDIQCNWGSLSSIIDHWGDYGKSLVRSPSCTLSGPPLPLLSFGPWWEGALCRARALARHGHAPHRPNPNPNPIKP
jgi:hypothetical protein